MQFTSSILAALAVAGSAVAQNMSVCDKYTTALLKNNTADNQLTVLTLLVNTVVIGDAMPKPNISGVTWPMVKVPGILANGTVNGTHVNLLPYFNGGLASTNRDGKAVSVNFLDDGGAMPLIAGKPANGMDSNQYFLLTHLYQFFGTLLGCSQQGMGNYKAYSGAKSMYDVHKFMDLSYAENTYFIQQVALAAQSFGVTDEDVMAVGKSLNMYFNVRCAAPVTLAPALGAQKQSICIDQSCPLAMNNTCSMYENPMQPAVANMSLAMGEGNSSATPTASASNGGRPAATSGSGASSSSMMGDAAQKAGSGLLAGLAAFAMLL